jgi:hypothetical protein
MENEFVSYTQALALKELGFDEDCFGFYNLTITKTVIMNNNSYGGFGLTQDHIIAAPLYQQAFRWFREKHNLHSTIAFTSDSIFAEGGYMFMVDIIEPHKAIDNDNTYKTYEEAESACLDKLIEIIENK